MPIKRILKSYLIVTIILTAFSLLNYNDTFKNYMSNAYVDVMGYKDSVLKTQMDLSLPAVDTGRNTEVTDYKDNPVNIVLEITNTGSNSMVRSGMQFADFMTLNFKNGKEDAKLETLKFSIHGTESSNIEDAYLYEKKKFIAKASIENGYIKFSNMEYALKPEDVSSLDLKVALSKKLKAGDMISLNIDEASDVKIRINGFIFSLNGHYPIYGKYLSIVGSRL